MTAVAGTDDDGLPAGPVARRGVPARVVARAPEGVSTRHVRDVRLTGGAGGQHDVARVEHPLALRGAHREGPPPGGLVVGAVGHLGRGPDVQLHRRRVGLEPVGDLVLGAVDRPRGRVRHVGQVVGPHRVVQDEGVVPLAPAVADPLALLEDERVDAHQAQVGRHGQAALAGAEDDDVRVGVGVGDRGTTLVEPVASARARAVARAARAVRADGSLVAPQVVELGHDRPGDPAATLPHEADGTPFRSPVGSRR